MTSRNIFLLLKMLNLVAITSYSFLLIYVLVRVLSLAIYPTAVLISSLGVYIIAADLGYSGIIYYRTRRSFVSRARPHGSEAEVFTLYLIVAVAAALVMGGLIAVFLSNIPVSLRLALALYFLSIVLALPWGLLRKVAAAVDLYLAFEVYELARRMFFLAIAAAMLIGLPFIAFVIMSLLAWVAAFAGATHLLQKKRQMPLISHSPAAIITHVQSNYRSIWQSGSLTLIEFSIYNFPYLAIPFLFTSQTVIVAFDVFYKVVRFGAVAYSVPAESFLPTQTRAFYEHNRQGVMRYHRAIILLGLFPLGAAVAVLFGAGDRIFTSLLSRGDIIGQPLRVSMAVMLAAMLFQNAAGTFLLGTGNYVRLSHLALITMGLMVCNLVATWALHLPFGVFMYFYVAAYCVHAMLYTSYLRRFVQSISSARGNCL